MGTMRRFVSAALLMPLVVAVVVVGGPAAAQDVKGDQELTEHAQKIDKAGSRADSGRVTAKIVEEFKGRTFDFGDGKGPRPLMASDVQNLRQKKLGFGEIAILLALASRTGQSPNAILQLRQSGLGWGQIAHQFKLKLGPVISSVKATEKGIDKVAREERERRDRTALGSKPEKAEKFEKPQRLERVERPARPERPGR